MGRRARSTKGRYGVAVCSTLLRTRAVIALGVVLALIGAGATPTAGFPGFGAVRPGSTAAQTDDGLFDNAIRFAGDGAGNWIAAWQSDISTIGEPPHHLDILYIESDDAGRSWSDPDVLDTGVVDGVTSASEVSLVADSSGVWLAAWSAFVGPAEELGLRVSRRSGLSEPWDAARPIGIAAGRVASATDNAGVWVIAFTSRDDPIGGLGEEHDVFYVRSADGGFTWSAAAPIDLGYAEGGGADDIDPMLVTDFSGTWLASWVNDGRIIVASSTDNGVSFGNVVLAADVSASAFATPRIATDREGVWIIVFASELTYGHDVGADYDLFYVVSVDDGLTWSTPEPLNSNAADDTSVDLRPDIGADDAGRFLVAWRALGDRFGGTIGEDADIVFARTGTADLRWSEPALISHAGADDGDATDDDVSLGIVGSGEWMVGWTTDYSKFGGGIGDDRDVVMARTPSFCEEVPATGCRSVGTGGGSSKIKLRNRSGGRDQLKWTAKIGDVIPSDFDDPTAEGGYAICLFAVSDSAELVHAMYAEADTACGTNVCWTARTSGYRYGDSDFVNGSLRSLSLSAKTSGRAKIRAQGAGPSLALPAMPLKDGAALLVQLNNVSSGYCIEAAFAEDIKNSETLFKGKIR